MTKQLRIEIERLWKRGEELKYQLIKMQKENARLREALKPFSELFYYPDDFGEYTSKYAREDEDWNEEANDEESSDYFIKRLWIKTARAALKEKE